MNEMRNTHPSLPPECEWTKFHQDIIPQMTLSCVQRGSVVGDLGCESEHGLIASSIMDRAHFLRDNLRANLSVVSAGAKVTGDSEGRTMWKNCFVLGSVLCALIIVPMYS